jgi:hypothetical protein
MAKPELPVIFRAERSGDFKDQVTAVLPTIPYNDTTLTTYAHVGQHGGGSYAWYSQHTRPATPKEYDSLLKELTFVYDGYKLVIRKKLPSRRYS